MVAVTVVGHRVPTRRARGASQSLPQGAFSGCH